MKSPLDPRHLRREVLMKKIFAWDFSSKRNMQDTTLKELFLNLSSIDEQIKSAAPQWPVAKIAKVDLSVLRLAIFEMTVEKKEPYKVIIDEAVELGKKYGNDQSASFINGVLGTIFTKLSHSSVVK
jgi:N utilization substance protein B